jgi:hypothetical protein
VASGDNVEEQGVEEIEKKMGSEMVWRNRPGRAGIYRVEGCCGGARAVDHGGDDWSGEGARRGARVMASIMAMLNGALA